MAPGFGECSICLETIKDPHSFPCGHVFCAVCAERCSKNPSVKRATCPSCRQPIKGKIIKLFLPDAHGASPSRARSPRASGSRQARSEEEEEELEAARAESRRLRREARDYQMRVQELGGELLAIRVSLDETTAAKVAAERSLESQSVKLHQMKKEVKGSTRLVEEYLAQTARYKDQVTELGAKVEGLKRQCKTLERENMKLLEYQDSIDQQVDRIELYKKDWVKSQKREKALERDNASLSEQVEALKARLATATKANKQPSRVPLSGVQNRMNQAGPSSGRRYAHDVIDITSSSDGDAFNSTFNDESLIIDDTNTSYNESFEDPFVMADDDELDLDYNSTGVHIAEYPSPLPFHLPALPPAKRRYEPLDSSMFGGAHTRHRDTAPSPRPSKKQKLDLRKSAVNARERPVLELKGGKLSKAAVVGPKSRRRV